LWNPTRKLSSTDGKNPNCVALGQRIKFFRKTKLNGMNQETFASVIDMHRTYLSGVESGARNPSYLALLQIANGLKIPLSELVEDLPKAPPS
jgi:transcriptional regulator with XRE-family HTH domain